jgi:hypothetical protein
LSVGHSYEVREYTSCNIFFFGVVFSYFIAVSYGQVAFFFFFVFETVFGYTDC